MGKKKKKRKLYSPQEREREGKKSSPLIKSLSALGGEKKKKAGGTKGEIIRGGHHTLAKRGKWQGGKEGSSTEKIQIYGQKRKEREKKKSFSPRERKKGKSPAFCDLRSAAFFDNANGKKKKRKIKKERKKPLPKAGPPEREGRAKALN